MKIPPNYGSEYVNKAGGNPSAAPKAREAESTSEVFQGSAGAGSPADKIDLSSRAKDLQKVRDVLKQTPDIREQKVQDLKSRVANGTYSISGRDVAEKMVNGHLGDLLFNA